MGLLNFLAIVFVIILLHELGHLLMAKKYGVRVNTFSVGFGPRIIGIKFYKRRYSIRIGNRMPNNPAIWFRKNITEYRIAPLLLGGFCALEGELKSTGKIYELASKPFNQKVQIALAGVSVNFITGVLALFGIGVKNHGFILGIKNTTSLIYQSIGSLFTGIYLFFTNPTNLTSAGEVNQIMNHLSFEYILAYFGVFSILMAIINFFPIPALDGSLPFIWLIDRWTKGKAYNMLKFIWVMSFITLMILQIIILYFWIFS